MTVKQDISLKYNKILFWAALILFVAEIVFVIISYHKAFPVFFELLKQAGSISTEEANAKLSEYILFSPVKFQFFFFISLILLILSFFRFYSVPDKLSVDIPSKFYRPIDVDFKPEQLFMQIESDPQYVKSMARLKDNKAYERKAKFQFFTTSLMLIVTFYLSSVLFKEYALNTIMGWYAPGGLFAVPVDFLHDLFNSTETPPQFTRNLFGAIFWGILFFGIIYLIYKFVRKKQYETDYIIETYDRSVSFCDACGYACVNILTKTVSIEVGRKKVGTEKAYATTHTHYKTTKYSDGSEKREVTAYDQKIYEYDVFDVSYEDKYVCVNCGAATTRARTATENGESRYIGSRTINVGPNTF